MPERSIVEAGEGAAPHQPQASCPGVTPGDSPRRPTSLDNKTSKTRGQREGTFEVYNQGVQNKWYNWTAAHQVCILGFLEK